MEKHACLQADENQVVSKEGWKIQVREENSVLEWKEVLSLDEATVTRPCFSPLCLAELQGIQWLKFLFCKALMNMSYRKGRTYSWWKTSSRECCLLRWSCGMLMRSTSF